MRRRTGSRPPAFDRTTYKERNNIEGCINRLKQRRGLVMRTDKLAIACQAASTSPRSSPGSTADQRDRT
jgi:hypothetical protein